MSRLLCQCTVHNQSQEEIIVLTEWPVVPSEQVRHHYNCSKETLDQIISVSERGMMSFRVKLKHSNTKTVCELFMPRTAMSRSNWRVKCCGNVEVTSDLISLCKKYFTQINILWLIEIISAWVWEYTINSQVFRPGCGTDFFSKLFGTKQELLM